MKDLIYEMILIDVKEIWEHAEMVDFNTLCERVSLLADEIVSQVLEPDE